MSTFIKIPGVNPPTSRPRVDRVDAILPDTGALVLLDASHPSGAWGSGAAAGLALTNIAGGMSDGVLGVGGSDIALARTPKKGLHVNPKAGFELPVNGSYARVTVPGLADYVAKNPTHSYYFSQWTKATRNGDGTAFTGTIAATWNSYLTNLPRLKDGTLSSYPLPTDATHAGSRAGQQSIGQMALNSVAASRWTGTPPATVTYAYPFMLGRTGPVQQGAGAHPALVFYRCYIEDLTVSGRTFAEVDALDNAIFTKECLTAGGRYFEDALPAA